MSSNTGKWLMALGIALVLLGVLIYFFHEKLSWFGRLPGDIRIEKENFRFYFPITSMLLISGLINLILYLIRKLN